MVAAPGKASSGERSNPPTVSVSPSKLSQSNKLSISGWIAGINPISSKAGALIGITLPHLTYSSSWKESGKSARSRNSRVPNSRRPSSLEDGFSSITSFIKAGIAGIPREATVLNWTYRSQSCHAFDSPVPGGGRSLNSPTTSAGTQIKRERLLTFSWRRPTMNSVGQRCGYEIGIIDGSRVLD